MRDPAFYMIWKRALSFFSLWSSYLPSHGEGKLSLPSVVIKKVESDKLVTYFENKYLSVTNALYLNERESKLSFEPYSFKIIKSIKIIKCIKIMSYYIYIYIYTKI